MLQYLINVTDNTFIPAIICAMLISAVRISGGQVKRITGIGALVGIFIAAIYAFLKLSTGQVIREFYDLTLLGSWMVIVIPSLVLLWLSYANRLKSGQRQLSGLITIRLLFIFIAILNLAIVFALFMPNLFLYPFEFGVGMQSIFNNDYLFKWVGYCLAILIMLLMAMFIYRVCQQLSDKLVLVIISVALTLFTVQNFITIAQILIVRRFIAYQQWLMDLVIFVLSHVNFFLFVFIIVSLLCALILFIKGKTTPLIGQNPAQIRKIKATIRRDRRLALAVFAGSVITAYTITRARYIFEKGVEISPADPVTADANGLIVIPLEKVNDGNLHRFGYETSDGTQVRFIIIKKSDNAYGVGLDACDICGATGYYQRGDQVVCSLCDVVMNIATIGFPGGCNPVPLKFEIINGNIVIKPVYLEAEKSRFK